MPCLIVAITITAICLRGAASLHREPERYIDALNASITQGNEPKTTRLTSKLQFAGGITHPQIRLAEIRNRLRHRDDPEAYADLHELAPYPGQGFPPAHRELAERLLQHPTHVDEPVILHHIQAASIISGNIPWAKSQLLKMHLSAGRLEQAAGILEGLIEDGPDYRYEYAKTLAGLGRRGEAIRNYDLAIEHYADRLKNNPNDLEANLQLIRCILDRFGFPTAEEYLAIALARFPASQELNQLKAEFYLDWYDEINERLAPRNHISVMMLRCIDQAVFASSQSPISLHRINGLFKKHIDTGMFHALIDVGTKGGEAGGLIHLLHALGQINDSQQAGAEVHLQLALKRYPSIGNLLVRLGFQELQFREADLRYVAFCEKAAELSGQATEDVVKLRRSLDLRESSRSQWLANRSWEYSPSVSSTD